TSNVQRTRRPFLSGGILIARFDTMPRPRSGQGNWYAGQFPDQVAGSGRETVTGRSSGFQTRLRDLLTAAHDCTGSDAPMVTFTPPRPRHSMRWSLPARVAAGADSIDDSSVVGRAGCTRWLPPPGLRLRP